MTEISKDTIWNEILESLRVSLSEATYKTWLSKTHISEIKTLDGKKIVEIGCESSYAKATIEHRYHAVIQDALTKALNEKCDVIFKVSTKKETEEKNTQDSIKETPLFETPAQRITNSVGENLLSKTKVRNQFTFENFAVSSTNQMAWAAAEAVTKNPGVAYNPLFIWGGVGVGKTHLMNAIGYSILEMEQTSNIYFCTGEDFTNDIVDGIRNKTTSAVRNKYRELDVLFIDDIQFIAGKDAVQEEFFHTFNKLVGGNKQILLTSDRPPSEISKLEERLQSRFEAGLIVDITEPDFELRCAITQIKASEKNLELTQPQIQIIAGNITSAREIEGYLTRLGSHMLINKSEITDELVQKNLNTKKTDGEEKLKASPQEIVTAVSRYYSVGKRQLMGTSRARPVARPRQILMYLLRNELKLPYQEVGRLVGGRDHSTVMHAVGKITILASKDVDIQGDISGIKKIV